MADDTIPPPFRTLFGGPALDEPAPPPPVEPSEGNGDGGGHFHHLHFVLPKLIVLSDGSTRTDGWAGSLLVGWCWLASTVTLWTVTQGAWRWLGFLGWGGFNAGLVGGVITAGLILCVVVMTGLAICQPTWLRRFTPVVLLISAAALLGFVTSRWWMS